MRVLQVRRILVLDHDMCGGVRMLLDGQPPGEFDFVTRWMDIAHPAKLATAQVQPPEARYKACEEATVQLSLANLMSFPWIEEAVAAGALSLDGDYFDIRHGVLSLLQPNGVFIEARH
ncbi:MAG: carbonic anhydrase, partial [Phenylobacterium sp.]|nr:carbonic anhydrase [Phenylobacterium sp.]